MEQVSEQKIIQDSFDDVIVFYNKNEALFKEFQADFGLNLWFLNHFRVFIKYRNLSLTKKRNNYKPQVQKQEKCKVKIFFSFLSEIAHIIFRYRPIKKSKSPNIILTNVNEIVDGKNIKLGDLEENFDKLLNRRLFNPKRKPSFKDSLPKNLTSSDHILLYSLFRLEIYTDFRRFYKSLKQLKKKISEQNSDSGTKDHIINRLFWQNEASYLIYYLRYKSYDIYFRNAGLEGILLSDENSPQQKVIQYAARNNKLNIFAFQHGNIHQLHPAYIYGKYTTKPMLPDITFTWGAYFTKLLINEGGYLPESVCNSGRIPFSNKTRHLNPLINTEDKILLYASQPHRDPSFRHRLTTDVFLAMKELDSNHKLVIRPHPSEKEDAYFKQIAAEVDFDNFIIDRDTDLATHLEMCELLIVAFSTVGTEFIPFYKPMLVLDYLGQDLIGWIREGVGISIKNSSELVEKLKSYSDLKIDKHAYNRFIENYFYGADGKVVERIKRAIYEKK